MSLEFPSATAALRLNCNRPMRKTAILAKRSRNSASVHAGLHGSRVTWDDMSCCVPLSYANMPACLPLHRMHTRVSDNTCASVTVRRQQHCDMGQPPCICGCVHACVRACVKCGGGCEGLAHDHGSGHTHTRAHTHRLPNISRQRPCDGLEAFHGGVPILLGGS